MQLIIKLATLTIVVLMLVVSTRSARAEFCIDMGEYCGYGYSGDVKCCPECVVINQCFTGGGGSASCLPASGCGGGCNPDCNGKVCGEGDGCGGSCPTSGNNQWSGWSCGSCTNPGNCGNVTMTQQCSRTNACGGSESMTQNCGSTCNECGPTFGPWGSCQAPAFERTRSENYNCSADQTDRQTCRGDFVGTIFDASVVEDCSAYNSQPKISGAVVTATATVNHTTAYTGITNGNGDYTVSNVLIPDNYDLTFTVDTSQWIQDPPKLLCNGALTGLSMTNQGQTITRRIGLYRIYGGWFQSIGGEMYGHNGVSVAIPATCALIANQASCNSYTDGGTFTPLVVQPDYGGTPGQAGSVFSKEGVIQLGGGGGVAPNAVVSRDGWNIEGGGYSGRRYDYGHFSFWFGHLSSTTWDGAGKPTGAFNALYNHTGNITWSESLVANEKIALIVDGNVTIDTNVDVPEGAYLGIIASGTITINSNVTQVEGHYVADTISVLGTGDTSTDQRFTGEGSFIGWDGVTLERDRGITNNSESSELFIARPDLMVNAPRGIRNPSISWQEVAP